MSTSLEDNLVKRASSYSEQGLYEKTKHLMSKKNSKNIKMLISNKKTGESPVSVGETEDTITYLWKQPMDEMTVKEKRKHVDKLLEECKENMKKQHQIFEKSNACPRRMNANEFSPLCQCVSSCSEFQRNVDNFERCKTHCIGCAEEETKSGVTYSYSNACLQKDVLQIDVDKSRSIAQDDSCLLDVDKIKAIQGNNLAYKDFCSQQGKLDSKVCKALKENAALKKDVELKCKFVRKESEEIDLYTINFKFTEALKWYKVPTVSSENCGNDKAVYMKDTQCDKMHWGIKRNDFFACEKESGGALSPPKFLWRCMFWRKELGKSKQKMWDEMGAGQSRCKRECYASSSCRDECMKDNQLGIKRKWGPIIQDRRYKQQKVCAWVRRTYKRWVEDNREAEQRRSKSKQRHHNGRVKERFNEEQRFKRHKRHDPQEERYKNVMQRLRNNPRRSSYPRRTNRGYMARYRRNRGRGSKDVLVTGTNMISA
eukprot:g7963.t1